VETHKGGNHDIIIVVMQRQAPTPYYILFSIGFNLQEVSTSIFLQATRCKEASTPICFLQATTHKRLLHQLAPT